MSTAKDPTAKPRRLHNFSFPNEVSWGSKRVLHCKGPVTAPSMDAPPPWNLRTRRSTCDSPATAERNPNPNPIPNPNPSSNTTRAEFSVSLSFEEIEEDFVRMKGRKPYRRPRKRPRTVQKKLDSLFPGLWLEEITADSYKSKKRPPPDPSRDRSGVLIPDRSGVLIPEKRTKAVDPTTALKSVRSFNIPIPPAYLEESVSSLDDRLAKLFEEMIRCWGTVLEKILSARQEKEKVESILSKVKKEHSTELEARDAELKEVKEAAARKETEAEEKLREVGEKLRDAEEKLQRAVEEARAEAVRDYKKSEDYQEDLLMIFDDGTKVGIEHAFKTCSEAMSGKVGDDVFILLAEAKRSAMRLAVYDPVDEPSIQTHEPSGTEAEVLGGDGGAEDGEHTSTRADDTGATGGNGGETAVSEGATIPPTDVTQQ